MKENSGIIIPLFLNAFMCVSQIILLFMYSNNMNWLMQVGCVGISFGTGLSAVIYFLTLHDK